MQRWLLVVKDLRRWVELDNDEITFNVDYRVKKGDKVLVYKSSPHNNISFIFEVKNDSARVNGSYTLSLFNKITLDNPVTLSELKNHQILDYWQHQFIKPFHKVPLCNWAEIIDYIAGKNPGTLEAFKAKGCDGPHPEGFSLKYSYQLLDLIQKIRSFDSFSFDEEATKYRIILPVLEKLGWNIYDLNQVYPEYPVRYKNEKVDYLLKDYNSNKIFIEAKKPDQTLDDHNCQIVKYCAAQNVHLGVLTNGINWRFYYIDFVDNSLGAIKNIKKEETNLLRDKPERIAEKLTDVFWGGNITRKKVSGNNKPNIKDIITKVKSIKKTHLGSYNEAAVKQVIIMPLMELLGWDINDEKHFSFDVWSERVKMDYSLINHEQESIIMEIKSMGDMETNRHDNHLGQIKNFAEREGYDYGILTDGKVWDFLEFNDGNFYEFVQYEISDHKMMKYLKKIS